MSEEILEIDASDLADADSAIVFKERCRKLFNEKKNVPVVLDATRINRIFSLGIGAVVDLHKECVIQDRSFSIKVSSDRIIELFDMLKLTENIKIIKI